MREIPKEGITIQLDNHHRAIIQPDGGVIFMVRGVRSGYKIQCCVDRQDMVELIDQYQKWFPQPIDSE